LEIVHGPAKIHAVIKSRQLIKTIRSGERDVRRPGDEPLEVRKLLCGRTTSDHNLQVAAAAAGHRAQDIKASPASYHPEPADFPGRAVATPRTIGTDAPIVRKQNLVLDNFDRRSQIARLEIFRNETR